MTTMHQMAFQLRSENIVRSTRFKLLLDYRISSTRLRTLEVRDLEFPDAGVGEILLPPELQKPASSKDDGPDDDPAAKALQEADALLTTCKQSLKRADASGKIQFDGAASSKAKRKRKVVLDENKESGREGG